MFDDYSISSTRKLVDKHFSLQWCRDNLVVPLSLHQSYPMLEGYIFIAVANYSYLGTIAEPIKQRLSQSDQKCIFIEKSQEEIQEILDLASEERFISGASIELSQFDEDAVLEAIKATSDIDEEKYDFQFDNDENLMSEVDEVDLATEMLESKIQNAAGAILINSKKDNVSDIHIAPKEDKYKIRVRKDGVMQPFMTIPKGSGFKLIACLKNMASMDIAEKRASQDGKILRKFEGNRMEFRCSTSDIKESSLSNWKSYFSSSISEVALMASKTASSSNCDNSIESPLMNLSSEAKSRISCISSWDFLTNSHVQPAWFSLSSIGEAKVAKYE